MTEVTTVAQQCDDVSADDDALPESGFTVCGYTFGEHSTSGVPVHYLSLLLKYLLPSAYAHDRSLKQTIESQFHEHSLELRHGVHASDVKFHVFGDEADGTALPCDVIASSTGDASAFKNSTLHEVVMFSNSYQVEPRIDESLHADAVDDDAQEEPKVPPPSGHIFKIVQDASLPKDVVQLTFTDNFIAAFKLSDVTAQEASVHRALSTSVFNRLAELRSLQQVVTTSHVTETTYSSSDRERTVNKAAGVHCTVWPEQASSFVIRQRLSSWPPQQYIEQIREKGVFLLPLTSATFGDVTDDRQKQLHWRVSFAQAENILLQLLTTDQRKCYVTLKLLYARFLQPFPFARVFTEQLLKCFFLWICEFLPVHDFRDTHAGCTLLTVLETLCDVITKRNLDHYFLDDVNMLQDCDVDEANEFLSKIRDVMTNVIDALLEINTQSDFKDVLNCRPKLSTMFSATLTSLSTEPMNVENFVTSGRSALMTVLRWYMDIWKVNHATEIVTEQQHINVNVLVDVLRDLLAELRDFDDVRDDVSNMDFMLGMLISVDGDPVVLADLYLRLCMRADVKDRRKMVTTLAGAHDRCGKVALLRGKQDVLASMMKIVEGLPLPFDTQLNNRALYMQLYKEQFIETMLQQLPIS